MDFSKGFPAKTLAGYRYLTLLLLPPPFPSPPPRLVLPLSIGSVERLRVSKGFLQRISLKDLFEGIVQRSFERVCQKGFAKGVSANSLVGYRYLTLLLSPLPTFPFPRLDLLSSIGSAERPGTPTPCMPTDTGAERGGVGPHRAAAGPAQGAGQGPGPWGRAAGGPVGRLGLRWAPL